MAYSRWSCSDTYFYITKGVAFGDDEDIFSCDCCILDPASEKICTEIHGYPNAIRHILDHLENGSNVNPGVVAALAEEFVSTKNLNANNHS